MAKRVRRFSISRKQTKETHQLGMDKDNWSKHLKFSDTDWKEKVKSGNVGIFTTEYGSLKSIVFDFSLTEI